MTKHAQAVDAKKELERQVAQLATPESIAKHGTKSAAPMQKRLAKAEGVISETSIELDYIVHGTIGIELARLGVVRSARLKVRHGHTRHDHATDRAGAATATPLTRRWHDTSLTRRWHAADTSPTRR